MKASLDGDFSSNNERLFEISELWTGWRNTQDHVAEEFKETFTVLQWNILAHGLDSCDDFPMVSKSALDFYSHRLNLITGIILKLEPDVVCLEELNHCEHFATLLAGYAMIFCAKLDSPCLPDCPPDGCAIFVKRTTFEVIHIESFYYKEKPICADDSIEDCLLQNQNAIVTKLRNKKSDRVVLVAVTHLKAKAGNELIRQHQINQLLQRIKGLATYKSSPIPIILCGDLNSDLKERLVYEAVFSDCDIAFSSCFNKFTQMQEFGRCVHFHDDPSYTLETLGPQTPEERREIECYIQGEPEYSTWKMRNSSDGIFSKKETIDYMFATLSSDYIPGSSPATGRGRCLRLTNCFPLIGPSISGCDGGMPSEKFPSDHLFLMSEFKLL